MKRVLIFALVLALLAVSMTSCKVKHEENKVLEDKVIEDESSEDKVVEKEVVEEENLQNKYNIIYTPSDETPEVSPEQLRIYWNEDTDRYGYETEDGEIIIPAIFLNSTTFFEGLAAVCRERNGPLEYIDASGNTVLTVEGIDGANAIDYYGFQPPCIFNDGVAVIYDGGFCIDKTGNVLNIKNPEGMYKYGLIAVRDPETKLIGYADIDGNIVIPGRYADVRDFEPQGVALVFSKESVINRLGLECRLRGYINTKGEEIIPLEYYDGPDCGASYIHPIHREVDGMIELYKNRYYHYFTYDGTFVEKCPTPRLEDNEEPLTYKLVEPTKNELDKMLNPLDMLFSHFVKDYDSATDNTYSKLFCQNEIQYLFVPTYNDEIKSFVSKPLSKNGYGKDRWNIVVNETDPLGRFGEIPDAAFDENGIFNEYLYLEHCKQVGTDGHKELSGYNKYDGKFIDWLVEGVWNGKVDHETFYEFADNEMLYYHEGNYYTPRFEAVEEEQITKYSAIDSVEKIDEYKYKVDFVVYDLYDRQKSTLYVATAVVGMKEASNGFRFWSIYSIQYEYVRPDDNDLMSYGIPYGLFYEYGDSVICPEEDDYNYIRINFDESSEINGYAELGVGFSFDDRTEYIDSNGAVYSELPDGGKYSYIRDWQNVELPKPDGVDYVFASPYGSNLLQFTKDGKYGYLNTDGEIVIEAQFYEARPFSEGLAAVCREYGDCLEYIDESGETVLKLEDVDGYANIFQMVDEEPSCDFSDGVALISCGYERICIDKEGNRLNIKNPSGMYKQGRIAFCDNETELYGFADKDGNIIIPAVYSHVFDFSQSGIALVRSTEAYSVPEEAKQFEYEDYYRGYIDTQGNVVIPIEFEQPWWLLGMKGFFEPFESYGIVSLYKQGYVYYYRYDGTLLGKKPRMAYVTYENESYKINVAEYWQWVNDGKPVG